jgi:hypothetical protein
MSNDHADETERQITYAALSGLFLSLFAAFALRNKKYHDFLQLKPFDLVQLGLATFRVGRLISYDQVTEPYRLPFTKTVEDSSGAGKTTVAKGSGVRRVIGELISCPICSGTWVAAILVYGMGVAPRATRAFIAIMSATGMAELLNAAQEALEWTGQEQRNEVGGRSSP